MITRVGLLSAKRFDREHELPLKRQAELAGISRGSVYYLPKPTSEDDWH